MRVTNANEAIEFVTTNARGVAEPKPRALAETVARAIASRYEHLSTWGHVLSINERYDMHQAIGVLRLEHFRLTGRAWLPETPAQEADKARAERA